MPCESNQTALATHALKGLAGVFRYSRRQSQAEDNWSEFSPADRFLLDQVYDAAWAVIQAHDRFRDLDQAEQLQSVLRQKLFVLAANGERDPQLLRNLLLAEMP